ncbi:hypothetical protein N2W54_002038 [Lotmaria passim]
MGSVVAALDRRGEAEDDEEEEARAASSCERRDVTPHAIPLMPSLPQLAVLPLLLLLSLPPPLLLNTFVVEVFIAFADPAEALESCSASRPDVASAVGGTVATARSSARRRRAKCMQQPKSSGPKSAKNDR